MSKIEKLVDRLLSKPADFTWGELTKVLNYYGYKEIKTGKTGGSRRKFADDASHLISLHKPHPGDILKHYQIKEVVESLKERGKLNE